MCWWEWICGSRYTDHTHRGHLGVQATATIKWGQDWLHLQGQEDMHWGLNSWSILHDERWMDGVCSSRQFTRGQNHRIQVDWCEILLKVSLHVPEGGNRDMVLQQEEVLIVIIQIDHFWSCSRITMSKKPFIGSYVNDVRRPNYLSSRRRNLLRCGSIARYPTSNIWCWSTLSPIEALMIYLRTLYFHGWSTSTTPKNSI